jgi:hypothetical protein
MNEGIKTRQRQWFEAMCIEISALYYRNLFFHYFFNKNAFSNVLERKRFENMVRISI